MSFKEVKEFRKKGELEKALEIALLDLESDNNNIWNKRSISWVYYDFLKANAEADKFDLFIKYLTKLKDLELPETENMIFDNTALQIGKIVFSIKKQERINYQLTTQIFDIMQGFHFTKPSSNYSFLFKAFLKGYKDWSKFIEFSDWWDFDNFLDEDYLSTEYNERKILSLVEQAFNAYSKKLLVSRVNPFSSGANISKEMIELFQSKLDKIISEHPEYQYPPFFKAKLLLSLGDKENILSAFLPFAKKKRNDFWVWELLSDIFEEDDSRKIACLCKALSLKTPEDFLIKTRLKLAENLIVKRQYAEAKTEVVKIVEIRQSKGWKIPTDVSNIIEQDWFKSSRAFPNNKTFYKKYIKEAEEIMFQDIPEEIIAIEFVNSNKKIANFIKDKTRKGFFNYSRHIDSLKIGDIVKVRFSDDSTEEYFKLLTLKPNDGTYSSQSVKEFKGIVRINAGNSFGFVDGVLINNNIIARNKLENGNQVIGKAILSFNKKKNDWGWKAYITQHEH